MLIPTNSKDIKGLRDFLTAQRVQACSVATMYTGPLKQVFDDLVSKVDGWLAKLPTDEVACGSWSLENQLDMVFSYAAQCSAAASQATLELSKLTGGQMAALTTEINKRVTEGTLFTKETLQTATAAAVKAQTDAGELVPKTQLVQLCAEANLKGVGEGEKKVRSELEAAAALTKTIDTRRALLQTASLPLPDAEIERLVLGGTDAEFAARKAAFETRREELKKEGIQLNSDDALANLWLDDNAYKGFAKTVKSLPALKLNPNPLATAGGAPGKAAATEAILIV